MTNDEIILEALDLYYDNLSRNDTVVRSATSDLINHYAMVVSGPSVRPVESLAQLDQCDVLGLEHPAWKEARAQHKAGHPNADGTMEDTRFHPVDEI